MTRCFKTKFLGVPCTMEVTRREKCAEFVFQDSDENGENLTLFVVIRKSHGTVSSFHVGRIPKEHISCNVRQDYNGKYTFTMDNIYEGVQVEIVNGKLVCTED